MDEFKERIGSSWHRENRVSSKETWTQRLHLGIRGILRNKQYIGFGGLLTLFSLVGTDCRFAFTSGDSSDLYFDVGLISCIVFFLVDIMFQVITKPSYMLSFYFYADILSSVLLVFDLSSIANAVLFIESYKGPLAPPIFLTVLISGGRQLRIIRFIRLLQISPPVRAFIRMTLHQPVTSIHNHSAEAVHVATEFQPTRRKSRASLVSNSTTLDENDDEIENEVQNEKIEPRLKRLIGESARASIVTPTINSQVKNNCDDSKVGRQLSELNTMKVGVLVILCSIVAPLVSSHDDTIPAISLFLDELGEFYQSENIESFTRTLSNAETTLGTGSVSDTVTRLTWIGFTGIGQPAPISIPNLGSRVWNLTCQGYPGKLISLHPSNACPYLSFRRRFEISKWSIGGDFFLILDEKPRIIWDSVFNIIQTIFTIILILLLSIIFDVDCNRVILIPISRMVATMRKIQEDPLCANSLIDKELHDEVEYKNAKKYWKSIPFWRKIFVSKPNILVVDSFREYSNRDTRKLEKTILKIGSLLVVGFGEAGAEIVGSNISNSNSIRSETTRSGKKVNAVFGYISILDFNTITEVLQDGIVVLVNQVAEIVHGIVDEFNGNPCKNLGNGFLIVWKFTDDSDVRLAELAVLAFCKIVAAIERSPVLATYREHPHLKMRLPGYKVRVGMGLHAGHAIEGAIGSEFKLDASYLGEDVVLAQRLETFATKVYRSCIVASDPLIRCISNRMNVFRKIDTICMDTQGSDLITLYTVDLDTSDLSIASIPKNVDENELKMNSNVKEYFRKQRKIQRKQEKLDASFLPAEMFDHDELLVMRRKFHTKSGLLFNQIFMKGFLNYQAGEWAVAKKALKQCLVYWLVNGRDRAKNMKINWATIPDEAIMSMQPSEHIDGPALAILGYILSSNHVNWRGFRSM
jgi:class 3 adenylate cyclase